MAELAYYEIPDYPSSYTAGTVLARLIDSLGFRYHWATEGLTETDLDYRPSEGGRSTIETLNHLHYLTTVIENTFHGRRYELPEKNPGLAMAGLRTETLAALARTSDKLKATDDASFEQMTAQFSRSGKDLDFPFWNLINGPIADALYHVGQLVCFRRTTNNPIDPGVQVFFGKRQEPKPTT